MTIDPGPATASRSMLAAFESRDFGLLFVSSVAASAAIPMMIIAGVLGWNLTGSYAITGVLSLSFGVPMLTLSLVGGAAADRLDRRMLAQLAQVGTAASRS